jgi:hypothetical protein
MTPERDTTTRDEPSRSDAPRAEAARRLPPVLWLLAVAGVVLVAGAVAAIVFAGPAEAIAVVAVGFAAVAAASLWFAITRAERHSAVDGRDHPLAGVGPDDKRPLGDTPEAHDEITPRDLPAGHPGRGAAERQAEALGGTTPGHREGGATPPRTGPLDELVDDDERDGARVDRGRG